MMLWTKSRLTKYGDAFISGADPVHAFNCIPGGGDRDDDDDEGDGEDGDDDANCRLARNCQVQQLEPIEGEILKLIDSGQVAFERWRGEEEEVIER